MTYMSNIKSYRIGKRLLEILDNIGARSRMAVSSGQKISALFEISVGAKQGDPISAAQTWNNLPPAVRSAGSIIAFRKQLKSYLYRISFA